ncbi:MAG: anthranilate synthase component I [Lachnospiraceae bacterium]|nr:anthranilate synthase component I [Lachnospiraceae bacterium]
MITMEEVKKVAQGYDIVPVCEEIMADVKTPIQVIGMLKTKYKHCFMLESVEKQERWGRYTFIGFEPVMELTCVNHELTIRGTETVTKQVEHPKEEIEAILNAYRSPKIEGMPSFTGGLVGYFSYDYLKYAEPTLKLKAEDKEGFKDMDLMLFDKVIAFDNLKQKILIIVNVRTDDLEVEYEKAVSEIKNIKQMIQKEPFAGIPAGKLKSDLKGMYSEEAFCEKVNKAKDYIKEGDIFQVVLSNRMEAEYEGSLFNAYRVLRTTNPSPYMFYFSSDDLEVAGASPETLVKLEDKTVYTFPLAGTRPRGKDKKEDALLEQELLADEKELAEHNMLVDLGRNDLGKICEFGTVSLEQYMSIERYSHVMHIGSTVRGTVRKEKHALDAIEAVLPAGTLSGAPKLRAMDIIDELEDCKRGIYGGAIGYIDFTGNMDTCIAIRIAYKKNGKVYIRSGAGIVADSVPEKEYQECINKAKAVVNALTAGEEEL